MSSAVEVIKSEISRRSREEAEKILSDAQERAHHIVSTAEMTSVEVLAKSIKPEISVMRKRILGSVRLEGRKSVIQTKSEIISRVFELVEERLRKIVEGKDEEYNYEELLAQLLREAALGVGENELTVTSNERTLAYLRKNLQQIEEKLRKTMGSQIRLKVEERPYNCIGGVVVRNPKGTKIFYNCLEGRLPRLKEVLSGNVAKILFG